MGGIWIRLSAAFGIALVVVVLLGLIGLSQFRTVRDMSEEFSGIWIPEVESIGRLRSGLIAYHHLSMRRLDDALQPGAPLVDPDETDVARAEAWAEIMRLSEHYGNVADLGSEQAGAQLLKERLADYETRVGEALGLAANGQQAAAETLFWTETESAYTAVVEQLDFLFAIAKEEGIEGAESARALFPRFAFEMGISVAIALLLMLAMSIWVRRGIVRPIEAVSDALRRLDKGDLSGGDVPRSSRKDEIGTLLNATHRYRDNLIARRDLENTVQEERGRLHTAIASMPLGFVMFDKDRKLVLSNEMFAKIYSLPLSLVKPGTDIEAIFDYIETNRTIEHDDLGEWRGDARAMIARKEASSVVRQTQDGRITTANVYPLKQGGWISLFEDITDRRKAQEEVAFLYSHDQLTRLPTRENLEGSINATLRARVPTAIHAIDLDRLAGLNEMLGHAAIDSLLQEIARRIVEAVGPAHPVGRLGGDEFAVAQVNYDGPEQVRSLTTKILNVFAGTFTVDDREVVVNANIGVALSPGDGSTAETLIHNAVVAMNRAKNSENSAFRFYEAGMDAAMQARRALEAALTTALERDEFELHYQPIIDLYSGSILGFEALLRWHNPALGMVPPTRFIPLAEQKGLIQSIGAWVVQEASRFAAKIPAPLFVAVNLSPAQLADGEIAKTAASAIMAAGIDGSRLEFEVTETLFLGDADRAMKTLGELRELGASLVMDDFGKGYSNLGYLLTFHFDKIKIDREFIQSAPDNPNSVAIIKAIVSLSKSLDMLAIAEGVETQAELDVVREFGCEEAQGFFIARPMSEPEAMLRAGNASTGFGSAIGA